MSDFTALQLIQDGHRLCGALLEEVSAAPAGRVTLFNQTALAVDAAKPGQGFVLAPLLLAAAELSKGVLVETRRDERPEAGGFHIVAPERKTPAPA